MLFGAASVAPFLYLDAHSISLISSLFTCEEYMKSRVYLLVLCFLCLSSVLSASVFTIDPLKYIGFVAIAGSADLANQYLDDEIMGDVDAFDVAQWDVDDVFVLDRWAVQPYDAGIKNWSDYAIYTTAAATAYVAWDDPDRWTNFMVLSEIMLAQTAVVKWTKTLAQRKRPYVYDEDLSVDRKLGDNARHSFCSMHASTAFSAATFAYYLHYRNFGSSYTAAAMLFVPATATAVLRVASGQHHPTDVIAGAAIGSAISYLFCRMHDSGTETIYLTHNGIGVRF